MAATVVAAGVLIAGVVDGLFRSGVVATVVVVVLVEAMAAVVSGVVGANVVDNVGEVDGTVEAVAAMLSVVGIANVVSIDTCVLVAVSTPVTVVDVGEVAGINVLGEDVAGSVVDEAVAIGTTTSVDALLVVISIVDMTT